MAIPNLGALLGGAPSAEPEVGPQARKKNFKASSIKRGPRQGASQKVGLSPKAASLLSGAKGV